MKYLALTAALFAAAPTQAASPDDLCRSVGQYAHVLMDARQAGVPLDSMLQTVEAHETDAIMKEFVRQMVIEAYERPKYETEKHQNRVKDEFRDSQQLRCLRNPDLYPGAGSNQ